MATHRRWESCTPRAWFLRCCLCIGPSVGRRELWFPWQALCFGSGWERSPLPVLLPTSALPAASSLGVGSPWEELGKLRVSPERGGCWGGWGSSPHLHCSIPLCCSCFCLCPTLSYCFTLYPWYDTRACSLRTLYFS